MNGVKKNLESVFMESVTTTMLPAYEKCTKQLFLHIRQTFLDGILEITNKLENYIMQIEKPNSGNEKIMQYIKSIPNELKLTNERLVNNVTGIILNDLTQKFQDLELNINKNIAENIENGIEKSFANQSTVYEESVMSVVRSQSQTPICYDIKEQIQALILQNKINKAFHQALLANDLNLVEYTIDKADIQLVFNPCSLDQKVILSLIQQITADMTCHTDIKQKYLSEAILSLDFRDSITKDHAPKILKEVCEKCQQFLSNQPSSHLASSVKMLLMAAKGVGQSSF